MKKFILFLIMGLFLINLASAGILTSFDNSKTPISYDKVSKLTLGNRQLDYTPIWEDYKPLKVENFWGLGSTIIEGAITKHDYTCGQDCETDMTLCIDKPGILVEDIRFKTKQNDNSWIKQDVRNYQLSYYSGGEMITVDDYEYKCVDTGKISINGTKEQTCNNVKTGSHQEESPEYTNFNIGDEFDAGCQDISLDAQKKPTRTVDFQIKTGEMWLEEWATWGSIDGGDDAEVILNSPSNGATVYSTNTLFNGSFNITGGATGFNMSLWNDDGGWSAKNSTSFTDISSDLIAYFGFEGGNLNDQVNGVIGTNQGSTNVSGVIGDARDFEVTDTQYIDYGDNIDVTGNYLSINVWVKPETQIGQFIVAKDENGQRSYGLKLNSGGALDFEIGGASGGNEGTYSTGSWQMITAIFDNTDTGNELQFWVNGVNVANDSSSGSLADTTADFRIGMREYGGSEQQFDGSIDELSIWNKVITKEKIEQLYNSGNALIATSITTSTQTWNYTIPAGDTIWNVQACDSDGDCGFASANYTISLDATPPSVAIDYPTTTLNTVADQEVLDLNTTITDTNLESCWYAYNGTNTTIPSCADYNFTYEDGMDNITVWANDTIGNIGSDTVGWNITIKTTGEDYDVTTTEGSTETFSLNVTLGSSYQVSTAYLYYNGTKYLGSFTRDGQDYEIERELQAPAVTTQENLTFYWNITTSEGYSLTTSSHEQTVNNIAIDDCSVYTTGILNLTLVDEETQIAINETTQDPYIYVDVSIFPSGSSTEIIEYSQNFTASNTGQVCIGASLAGSIYDMDVTIQYGGTDYRTEHYNIRGFSLESSVIPQNITLYAILIASSENFIINFKDGSFQPLSDALITVSRQYVAEGQFKTVEVPITDYNGRSVSSLSPEDTAYTFYVTKNGELLATFNNVAAICENELTGDCTINLNALSTVIVPGDYANKDNVAYTLDYDETTRTVSVTFTITDGTVSDMELELTNYDRFMNDTVCTDSLTSSSGSLSCVIPFAYTNQTVSIELFKDDFKIHSTFVSLQPDGFDFFGYDAVIFAIFMFLTIPLMFISSPVGMMVGIFLGVVMAGLLMFSSSVGVFGGISVSLVWLLVVIGIVIWKLTQGGRSA